MNSDFIDVFSGIKTIALVGNAGGVIDPHAEIDKFDCVVRLNGGYQTPATGERGIRTDVLCTSSIDCLEMAKDISCERIWMTQKNRDQIRMIDSGRIFFYPEGWWIELMNKIGSRPSTGLMAIDLFVRAFGGGKVIKIFGYNFYESKHFNGKGRGIRCPHDFLKEKIYVDKLVREGLCEFQPVCKIDKRFSIWSWALEGIGRRF